MGAGGRQWLEVGGVNFNMAKKIKKMTRIGWIVS
jgi:hypothetical protein